MSLKRKDLATIRQEHELVELLMEASRRWGKPLDYIMLKKELNLTKAEVQRIYNARTKDKQ